MNDGSASELGWGVSLLGPVARHCTATRPIIVVGSDDRCDLAVPGLQPFHVLVVRDGTAAHLLRLRPGIRLRLTEVHGHPEVREGVVGVGDRFGIGGHLFRFHADGRSGPEAVADRSADRPTTPVRHPWDVIPPDQDVLAPYRLETRNGSVHARAVLLERVLTLIGNRSPAKVRFPHDVTVEAMVAVMRDGEGTYLMNVIPPPPRHCRGTAFCRYSRGKQRFTIAGMKFTMHPVRGAAPRQPAVASVTASPPAEPVMSPAEPSASPAEPSASPAATAPAPPAGAPPVRPRTAAPSPDQAHLLVSERLIHAHGRLERGRRRWRLLLLVPAVLILLAGAALLVTRWQPQLAAALELVAGRVVPREWLAVEQDDAVSPEAPRN